MRKLFGLALAGLALVALLFVGQGATTSAQQPSPDNDTILVTAVASLPRAHVCYSVEKGHSVNVDARLVTDNFGGDRVTIGRLVMMCELSGLGLAGSAAVPPPVPDTRILACYSLRDGGSPNDPYRIDTFFAKDTVIVTRSNLMCETAAKYVTDALGNVSKFGTPSGNVRQCYDLKYGDDAGGKYVMANNNFGRDEIVVGAGVQMCEEAEKHRIINGVLDVTGFANGVVEECFRMSGRVDPKQTVVLETENFGRAEVVVRAARMLCVNGEKTPLIIDSFTAGRQP